MNTQPTKPFILVAVTPWGGDLFVEDTDKTGRVGRRETTDRIEQALVFDPKRDNAEMKCRYWSTFLPFPVVAREL